MNDLEQYGDHVDPMSSTYPFVGYFPPLFNQFTNHIQPSFTMAQVLPGTSGSRQGRPAAELPPGEMLSSLMRRLPVQATASLVGVSSG